MAGLCWLTEMLRPNIVFQALPGSGKISHLCEVRRLETARLVGWIESIVSQLSGIDAGSLWVGDAAEHESIIPPDVVKAIGYATANSQAQPVQAQFAQTACDEMDLNALTRELAPVVQATSQPYLVSIWHKESTS